MKNVPVSLNCMQKKMNALITTQSAQLSYVLCYATTLQVIWFYYYQIVIVLVMIFYLFDTIIVGYNLFIE